MWRSLLLVGLLCAVALAAVASPQRSKRDTELLQKVQEFLRSKAEYAHVKCEVDDAVVTLSGDVKLLSERRALVHSVKRIQNVSRVDDRVILLPANLSDQRLSAAVRERLESAGLSHLKFKAHEGWVQVEGQVHNEQERQRLMDMIRGLPGVKEADFQKLRAVSSNKS
jgi:osmotically-inducible protein OsmY